MFCILAYVRTQEISDMNFEADNLKYEGEMIFSKKSDLLTSDSAFRTSRKWVTFKVT